MATNCAKNIILVINRSVNLNRNVHRCLSTSVSCSKESPTSLSSASPDEEFRRISVDEYHVDGSLPYVLKICQRFKREPEKWPEDERSFAIAHADFVGCNMHQMELRPERAFGKMFPFGFYSLRIFGRKLRAKMFHRFYRQYGLFDQKSIMEGARRCFEVVSQAVYKDKLKTLADRGLCSLITAKTVNSATQTLTSRQRSLLDLSEDDIVAIAPGVLGPFQDIVHVRRENEIYLKYSILCCAYYRRKLLFDAVKNLPLLSAAEPPSDKDCIAVPCLYGYSAPRFIFAYFDFAQVMRPTGFDSDVELFDFQFLVL